MAGQRQPRGQTDLVDMVAIIDLLLASRGNLAVRQTDDALVQVCAWVAHRRRRVEVRGATRNQLQGQVDRCFPGLAACLSSVLDTKVGRLVVTEFADPARLAHLAIDRFCVFAARRNVIVQVKVAERLVAAAKAALPTAGAVVARVRCWYSIWRCWEPWTPRSPRLPIGCQGCCRPPAIRS
jgi:hypothetical protein